MIKLTLAALACAAIALAGCASSSKSEAAATPVNSVCPIGGHEIGDSTLTATHKGQVVAFCCEGCAETWADETEEGRDEILMAAMNDEQVG